MASSSRAGEARAGAERRRLSPPDSRVARPLLAGGLTECKTLGRIAVTAGHCMN